MNDPRPAGSMPVAVRRVRDGVLSPATEQDRLATEEPLEIRLKAGSQSQSVAITMRTPGHDYELAAGFLFSEGVIDSRDDFATISYCVDRELAEAQRYNVVNVSLRSRHLPDIGQLHRHFSINSSCGVCGKSSLDAIERCITPVDGTWAVEPALVTSLPGRLRDKQQLFDRTGGLHAAAAFTRAGELIAIREDVGRHNAVDKVVGHLLMEGRLPLSDSILLVSGRASFELVQKAAAAGIPMLCAVSAPSTLAVDLARRMNMTLVGFLRGDTFNIYTGEQRLSP